MFQMSGCISYCTTQGYSDMFVFDTISKVWSWIQGEGNATNIGGFGTVGVNDGVNFPPRRGGAGSAYATNSSNIILFGGRYNNPAAGMRQDVWYLTVSNGTQVSSLSRSTSAVTPSSQITSTSALLTSSTLIRTSTSVILSSSTTLVSSILTSSVSVTSLANTSMLSALSSTTADQTPQLTSTLFDSSSSTSQFDTLSVTPTPQINTPTGSKGASTDSPSSLPNLLKQYFYVVVILIVLVIGSIAISIWYCCTRCSRQTYKSSRLEDNNGTTYSTRDQPTATWSGGISTFLSGQTEFAVPAFLKFKAGLEFRWHKRIAIGGGGAVYLGDALIPKLKEFGDTIIVKIVGQSRDSVNQLVMQAFDQEISVMHYLGRHRNIAVMLGWCDEPVAMLMKCYPSGSLDGFLSSVVTKARKLSFMSDVSQGLAFMHAKEVAHCDMKPPNILVDRDACGEFYCVLTDFGISQIYSTKATLVHSFEVVNMRGVSIAYAAPEAVIRFRNRQDANKWTVMAGDVYSLGMIVFAILKSGDAWK